MVFASEVIGRARAKINANAIVISVAIIGVLVFEFTLLRKLGASFCFPIP